MKTTKHERLEHANALIKIISSHGRRFFYNKEHDRVARLELCERGRIWFIDDYSNKRIYTHKTGFGSRWRGFSHGGTLQSLICALRDYVSIGKSLARGYIAPERSYTNGDIWGYGESASAVVRDEAFKLPIFATAIEQQGGAR